MLHVAATTESYSNFHFHARDQASSIFNLDFCRFSIVFIRCLGILFFFIVIGTLAKAQPLAYRISCSDLVDGSWLKASALDLIRQCDHRQSQTARYSLPTEKARCSFFPRATRDPHRVLLSAEVRRNDFFPDTEEGRNDPPLPVLNNARMIEAFVDNAKKKKEKIAMSS